MAGNCHHPDFFLLIRTKIFQTKQAFVDLHFVKPLDVGGVFNVAIAFEVVIALDDRWVFYVALVFNLALVLDVAIVLDDKGVFNVA